MDRSSNLGGFAGALGGGLILAVFLGVLLFTFEWSPAAGRSKPDLRATEGPETGGRDQPEEEPEAPLKKARRWPSRRSILFGAFYLLVVVGAVVLAPRIMAWTMDTQRPIATVSGSSMWPTLKKGDLVAVKGVDAVDDLQVGDIIAFRHGNGLAVHRIVSIEGEVITTRGDANLQEDPPINIDQVVGKLISVGGRLVKLPLAGHLSMLLGPLAQQATDVLQLGDDGQSDLGAGRVTPIEEYEDSGDKIILGGSSSGQGERIGTVEDMAQGEDTTSSEPEGTLLGTVSELPEGEIGSSQEPQGSVVPAPAPAPAKGSRR